MATSGTHTFTLMRDQVIRHAFLLLNIYDINTTISSDDLNYANDHLNMMLLYWSSQGIRLWKRKQLYVFPALNTLQYSLGLTGDHNTESYIATELTVAALAAATTLTVTSTTGMTAGDHIGIELDSGVRQWTTIVSVNSATGLTITAGLSGAAAIDNTIITYTSKASRPLRLIRGTTLDLKNDQTETTMMALSFDEYFNMPAKTTAGTPNNYYYDKALPTGQLYLFPRPNDVSKICTFTYLKPIEDSGDATDEIDIPKEWLLPAVWNLGVQLAYPYEKTPMIQALEMKAKELFESVKYYDTDDESMRLGVID